MTLQEVYMAGELPRTLTSLFTAADWYILFLIGFIFHLHNSISQIKHHNINTISDPTQFQLNFTMEQNKLQAVTTTPVGTHRIHLQACIHYNRYSGRHSLLIFAQLAQLTIYWHIVGFPFPWF